MATSLANHLCILFSYYTTRLICLYIVPNDPIQDIRAKKLCSLSETYFKHFVNVFNIDARCMPRIKRISPAPSFNLGCQNV